MDYKSRKSNRNSHLQLVYWLWRGCTKKDSLKLEFRNDKICLGCYPGSKDVKQNDIDAPNNSVSYSIDQDGCEECFVYYHFDSSWIRKLENTAMLQLEEYMSLVNVIVKRCLAMKNICSIYCWTNRQLLHFFGILFKIHAVLDCAVSFCTMPFCCFDTILSSSFSSIIFFHRFFTTAYCTCTRVHVLYMRGCAALLWCHRLILSSTFIRKDQS